MVHSLWQITRARAAGGARVEGKICSLHTHIHTYVHTYVLQLNMYLNNKQFCISKAKAATTKSKPIHFNYLATYLHFYIFWCEKNCILII